MKKILGFLAVVTTAAICQATAVGWTMTGVGADKSGSQYYVFVIGQNGVTGVSSITGLLDADDYSKTDISAIASKAFGSGTVDSGGAASKGNASSGLTIEYKGSGEKVSYDAFAVIFNQADPSSANGNYVVTDVKTISFSSNTGGKNWAFGNQSAQDWTANSYKSVAGVPEPTSVALIALGLAALGLKRKVA